MTFTPDQIKLLEAPLDPKHVVKPSGSFGPKGDYLEGWHVINEMNRVFGFDGWSYRIELKQDALAKADGKDQWQAAYTCICTLTVGDTVRQDVGFGSGFSKQIGDAVEGATKEAVTDALKRCARTFGNIFGLALYDKSRANVQAPPVEFISDDDRDELVAMAEAAGVALKDICAGYQIASLKELPAAKFKAARDRLSKIIQTNAEKKEAA